MVSCTGGFSGASNRGFIAKVGYGPEVTCARFRGAGGEFGGASNVLTCRKCVDCMGNRVAPRGTRSVNIRCTGHI